MLEWVIPRNLKDLHGFLGLTSYYRNFITKYAQIVHPFMEQLKKDAFGWSEKALRLLRS